MGQAARYVGYTACVVGGIITIRITLKVWRLLSHREEPYYWLGSIIPPNDYNFSKDCQGTRDHIKQHHPELLDVVEHGTLSVLTRPPDFDRAMPDELYILGTAHVSRKTADAVYRTIRSVDPDAVVVELDKSRAFMMYREVPPDMYQLSATEDKEEEQEEAKEEKREHGQGSSSQQGSQLTETGGQQGSPQNGTAAGRSLAAQADGDTEAGAAPAAGAEPKAALQVKLSQGRKRSKAQPGGAEPDLGQQLRSLVQSMRAGNSPLQALLSWAYMRIEAQLGTVAGLEFIRARHAIQELELRRTGALDNAAGQTQVPPSNLQPSAQAHEAQPAQVSAVQQAEAGPSEEQPVHGTAPQFSPRSSIGSSADVLGSRDSQQVEVEAGGGGEGQDSLGTPPRQVPRVHVYLGDVPLQRTISRMWGVLGVRQKLRLLWTLLKDCLTLHADDDMLEALMEEDMLQLMQQELGGTFPEVLGPLLHERNWQLAYTVHQAAQHGMRRVVLVVGRGHVPGIVYCLLHPYRMRQARKTDSQSSDGGGSSSHMHNHHTSPQA